MIYAQIKDNAIERITSRPKWLDDNGDPVTDAVLQDHGWLPVIYEQPEHDPLSQRVIQLPKSEWAIEPTRVVAAYEIHEIPIDDLRDSKLQEATDMRWQVMTGGMTLPNGVQVGTTIDDQNRITSVVANAALAGLTDADEVDFKSNSGWVQITIGQVKAIAGAIGQFVQACYTAERTHHDAIDLLATAQELHAYDVNTGWPTSE